MNTHQPKHPSSCSLLSLRDTLSNLVMAIPSLPPSDTESRTAASYSTVRRRSSTPALAIGVPCTSDQHMLWLLEANYSGTHLIGKHHQQVHSHTTNRKCSVYFQFRHFYPLDSFIYHTHILYREISNTNDAIQITNTGTVSTQILYITGEPAEWLESQQILVCAYS